jgi:type VI secretion system protein
MHEERLLERIRSVEREPAHRGGYNRRSCLNSVLSHLQHILNTRQGNVGIAVDYGVPDFFDFLQSYPESVHAIERSIKTAIDKYEPRLCGAVVSYLPDEEGTLVLRFQIIASLTEELDRKICLESVVAADGRIRLHR